MHFSSLIPKMLMFALVISCLTPSNLPWFMDLSFQVPMQSSSLQHWILLPSAVISTAGCCFCFGSVPSFFLELFHHSSPVAYWAPTNLGSKSFSVIPFCLFILFLGFSGFPVVSDGTASARQCGRPGLDPWFRKTPWRRKWQPILVLLPGKFHGQRSLVGYSPWGRKEWDTTERLHFMGFARQEYWIIL